MTFHRSFSWLLLPLSITVFLLASVRFSTFWFPEYVAPQILKRLQTHLPNLIVARTELVWQGWTPVIRVHDLLNDASSLPWRAEQIVIRLNLWESLFTRTLAIDSLVVHHAEVNISLSSSMGGTLFSNPDTASPISDLLLKQKISLEHLELRVYHESQLQAAWTLHAQIIPNVQGVRSHGHLVQDHGGTLHWRYQIYSDSAQYGYLRATDFFLQHDLVTALLPEQTIPEINLHLNAEGWFNGNQRQWQEARWRNHQIRLQRAEETLEILGGKGQWRRFENHRWQLTFDDWRTQAVQKVASALTLNYDDQWDLIWQQGDLASISTFFLPEVAVFTPKGTIHRLHWYGEPGAWSSTADVRQLTINHSADFPGVHNIDVQVQATPKRLEVRLKGGERTVFDWPQVFSQPLIFTSVTGNLLWQRENVDGWKLHLHDFHLQSGDGASDFNLSLLQTDRETPLYTDLSVRLHQQTISAAKKYIPFPLLRSERLRDWLRNNLHSGILNAGNLRLSGDLKRFQHADTRFALQLDMADAALNFAADWPMLYAVDAQAMVNKQGLQVLVERARSEQLLIGKGELALVNGLLTLQIPVKSSIPETQNWIQRSPLASYYPALLNTWEIQGKTQIALDFDYDLQRNKILRQRSTIQLREGRLRIPQIPHIIEDIFANIQLTPEAFVSEQLHATWNGQPVQGRIAERRLYLQTRIAPQDYLPPPAPSLLTGATSVQLVLNWQEQLSIRIDSTLEGITINLPPPLYKPANAIMPFQLDWQLHSRRHTARINWDNRLFIAWQKFINQPLQDFALNFGHPIKDTSQGLHIDLRFTEWDLEPWWQLARSYFSSKPDNLQHNPTHAITTKLNINIIAERLHYDKLTLSDLNLSTPEPGHYRLQSDRIAGELHLDETWQLQLRQLHLPEISSEPVDSEVKDNRWQLDLITWPAIDLRIDDLRIGEQPYGAWQARGEPQQKGYTVTNLHGMVEEMEMQASYTQTSAESLTHNIDFSISGSGLQSLLPSIEGRESRIEGELRWEGGFELAALKRAEGSVELNITQGIIPSRRRNPLALLGLLNIDTLLRRLQLDFSDLNQKGVAFDQLQGSFYFSDGLIESAEPFELRSSTFALQLTGSTDLRDNTLDQTMNITLPLSQSLPLAAVLAGSPQLFGILWLADKVASQFTNRFSSAQYHVTGSLDAPQLELVRLFNNPQN